MSANTHNKLEVTYNMTLNSKTSVYSAISEVNAWYTHCPWYSQILCFTTSNLALDTRSTGTEENIENPSETS
jgi:hypothetical protein